jgi:protein AIR1/2
MARVTPDEVETDTALAPPTSSPEHDAAAAAPTEPHHTADIVIEEIPRSPASPSTKIDRPSAGPDHDHDHFDPPGLFSTSLMPTLVPLGSKSPHVELRPSEETVETSRGKDGAGSNDEEKGLLLPSHVMLDTVAAVDEADEEERPVGDSSMEGLHFVDDDVAKVGWVGIRHSHFLAFDPHVDILFF